jgi:hypothetical protein
VAACLHPLWSAFAGENGVLPYKDLDQLWEVVSRPNPTNLAVSLCVVSTNPAVSPSDFKLTVQSARGPIPVELTTNGVIRTFPRSKELRKENPPVASNQPRGSLRLMISSEVPVPNGLVFRYSRLRAGAAELNRMIKAQAGLLSPLVPKANGVIFQFPTTGAGKATVEIGSGAGRKVYTADPQGHVRLKLESRVADDAEVKISEKLESLRPQIE